MKFVVAERVVLLLSLTYLVCEIAAESSDSKSGHHKHLHHQHPQHKGKRHDEENPTEQVYYVDQIASDSEITPWTSNRIFAKTTENGRPSHYIINVSPDDEVIIHETGATARKSDHEPERDQSPQDFVQQALRLREQYIKGNNAKSSANLPASSFVEYTTVKYDHGPSRTPTSAAPAHHGKPVQSKVSHLPPQAAAAHQIAPVTHRPKHIKAKPTRLPGHSVTPYSEIELPEAETTSAYRKEGPKEASKSPKHTIIKQQDTSASSLYIQKVKGPVDPVFSSYNTHHDTGSSFKEYQQLPVNDNAESSSVLNVHKVKAPTDVFNKHKHAVHFEDVDEYFEKKHKKHSPQGETRHRPKHIKMHHDRPKAEQNENYPEKIRHTVERPHPFDRQPTPESFHKHYHPKSHETKPESTLEPYGRHQHPKPHEPNKGSFIYESQPSPSIETYHYQPPKSYPPEEAIKYKAPKYTTTTPEPYQPYQHIKTITGDKSKLTDPIFKDDPFRHTPLQKPHHIEYTSEKSIEYNPEQFKDSRHIPSKLHNVEMFKTTSQSFVDFGDAHDFFKAGPTRPPKYYEEPSKAPSYAKVTTYPTQGSSNLHSMSPTVDPYKIKPSPHPEISINSHGFTKPFSASFPKFIPTKMPELDEPSMSFNSMFPSSDPISNYVPSSTQESFSASPEYPKLFSFPPTTYTPKYASTAEPFEFQHMNESPKTFIKFSDPTPTSKVYGSINPSEETFKTLSTKIIMKPSPTEYSFPSYKEITPKPMQNLSTSIIFKPSPSEEPKSEYYTNPEHTTYYVFANGTEIKLGNDPSKIPPEFRITNNDALFLSTNYSTKLAEDFAMKYNWDPISSTSTKDSPRIVSPDSIAKDTKHRPHPEYILREKKKGKHVLLAKPIKPIKTVTIYRNTHRSADDTDLEGGFEPSDHFNKEQFTKEQFGKDGLPQISNKKGEVADDDEDFFFANGEVILEDDPSKASKKNSFYIPPEINNLAAMKRPGQIMLKMAPPAQHGHEHLGDLDMSAEPSKKHQYFILYHIEDDKKKHKPTPPTTTTAAPTPPPVKQEIHYHYNEKEDEDDAVHEHYNYHHEETIEDMPDNIQHLYVNKNFGKQSFRPSVAHPPFKYKDALGSGSETSVRVVEPDHKPSHAVELSKQEYMRQVQSAVLKYMKELQDQGRLPAFGSQDSDETSKNFEELDISALINGNNLKQKFQIAGPTKVSLPINPSHYKPMKSVPSSSTYKTVANMKLPKNTYTAGKPLKAAIESLQEQMAHSVDLTVKGTKSPVKPDLSAIDVGQSYLHGPSYDPPAKASNFNNPTVLQLQQTPKTKLHFNQQTYHDINSLTNVKDAQSLKGTHHFAPVKGGTANVGASINFAVSKGGAQEEGSKLGPEALDAPIQIINGIPITNPYNIDINTLRYMLGGLAQAQAETQPQLKQPEPTLKLKGSNWMSLPTLASPSQVFSPNLQSFQHGPSEASNYKYNVNFDSNNFKIKIPKGLKDVKPKPVNVDSIGSASMNYAAWGEPLRQNRQVSSQHPHPHHHHPQQSPQPQQQQQQQQLRPTREFNPELFLNPHYPNSIMKKKNGPLDRKAPVNSKPVAVTKAKSNLDTSLRPPPR
ncbi:uncharacterized protein LOC129751157 [Uranotaenia lowii]|uniref:uncharacterized protein LOC129751157 n=1 Tax=Uranotaenia lowii TaxID=190385 RepID=UPI0024798D60|nr:uncharacterized protein LOC129751157 [Uranotaenia lowii]